MTCIVVDKTIYHAKPHSICFLPQYRRNEIFVLNWKHRLGFERARAALRKWAACTRQTISKTFVNSLKGPLTDFRALLRKWNVTSGDWRHHILSWPETTRRPKTFDNNLPTVLIIVVLKLKKEQNQTPKNLKYKVLQNMGWFMPGRKVGKRKFSWKYRKTTEIISKVTVRYRFLWPTLLFEF